MKKQSFIDSVRVKDPCTQAWDEMTGDDRVRFCNHCEKDVNDLSAMTRKEALKLVRKSGGSLCIRYIQHPRTKAPVFAEQLTQISRRRTPLMAAGVMTASLSLSALTYAQGGAMVPARDTPSAARASECEDIPNGGKADPSTKKMNGVIRGRVVDPAGAVVPGATVSLADDARNQHAMTRSDDSGEFRFENLSDGPFTLRTDANAGFAASEMQNVKPENPDTIVEITLQLSSVEVVLAGVVAVGIEFQGKLAIAVANDDLEEAKKLLTGREPVDQEEEDGTTPLFIAVENGNLEMVELLLNHGAKVNVHDKENETALMKIDDDASLELVQLLIRSGADVNQIASNGDTPLILAARLSKPEALGALVAAGAELNAQNLEGVTALMNAVDTNNIESVRTLLLAGADVNLRDKEGDTAWSYTSESDMEKLLVAYGAILDPEDVEEPSVEPEDEKPDD